MLKIVKLIQLSHWQDCPYNESMYTAFAVHLCVSTYHTVHVFLGGDTSKAQSSVSAVSVMTAVHCALPISTQQQILIVTIFKNIKHMLPSLSHLCPFSTWLDYLQNCVSLVKKDNYYVFQIQFEQCSSLFHSSGSIYGKFKLLKVKSHRIAKKWDTD